VKRAAIFCITAHPGTVRQRSGPRFDNRNNAPPLDTAAGGHSGRESAGEISSGPMVVPERRPGCRVLPIFTGTDFRSLGPDTTHNDLSCTRHEIPTSWTISSTVGLTTTCSQTTSNPSPYLRHPKMPPSPPLQHQRSLPPRHRLR